MTNYLILREKVRAFRADPEVQAALWRRRGCPSWPYPPSAEGETWQDLRGLAAARRRGARRPRRWAPSTSTSWPSSTSTASAADGQCASTAAGQHRVGPAAATPPRCCARCAPAAGDPRAELAQRTGLAKATVGTIVAALEAGGVAGGGVRAGRGPGSPGRPVTLLGDRSVGLGLELNVDYVAAVVLDLAGAVVWHETRPVGADGPLGALTALAAATAGRDHRGAGSRLVGATSSRCRAWSAPTTAPSAWAPNLDIDGDRARRRGSTRALGGAVPVRVSNDADCAAYAESHHGAATRRQPRCST